LIIWLQYEQNAGFGFVDFFTHSDLITDHWEHIVNSIYGKTANKSSIKINCVV